MMKALKGKVKEQKQLISTIQEDLDATCASLEDALEEVNQLHSVQEELELAREEITSLQLELDELWQSKEKNKALADVVEAMGGLKKIDDKGIRVAAISSLLITFLGVIMKGTYPITHLHAVCEALFDNILFGVEAMKVVLQELSNNKIQVAHQKNIYTMESIMCN
jgi:hypothetical protein